MPLTVAAFTIAGIRGDICDESSGGGSNEEEEEDGGGKWVWQEEMVQDGKE